MMKYFLVSSLILLFTGCATTSGINRKGGRALSENNRLWTNELRDNETINRYQAGIFVNGNNITGICMLKKSDEGWRGTLINEFGVKAFDFIVTPQKCELLNMIAMMNKWYIRRTIAGDLHFLIEVDNPDASFQSKTTRIEQNGILTVSMKRKSITRLTDNQLVLNNLKRNIVYSLNNIPQ